MDSDAPQVSNKITLSCIARPVFLLLFLKGLTRYK